jgi:peptide/nickel transport system permease protein
VVSLRERDFVLAARTCGVSDAAILVRHIVPHVIPTVIVYGTLGVATAIMLEAALSYIGIGIRPPDASWGNMISEGQPFLMTAPWLIALSAAALVLAMLGFSLFGDGLRDALDPTLERGRRLLGGIR